NGSRNGTHTSAVVVDREAPPVLETRGVSVSFGGNRAVHDVSMTVAPHEAVGIIGPNGAGKTTLFDLVSGFLRVDAGRVLLNGADVTGRNPAARAAAGLGRSFQDARLFPSLTVADAIAGARARWVGARDPIAA